MISEEIPTDIVNISEEIPTDNFRQTPHFIRSSPTFFPISLFLSAPLSLSSRDFRRLHRSLSRFSGESPLILPHNHVRTLSHSFRLDLYGF